VSQLHRWNPFRSVLSLQPASVLNSLSSEEIVAKYRSLTPSVVSVFWDPVVS
jgi:hypothetical protein